MPTGFYPTARKGLVVVALAGMAVMTHAAETRVRAQLTKAILDRHPYQPAEPAKSTEPPSADQSAPRPAAPLGGLDIVVLPKYEVRSASVTRGLTEEMVRSRPPGPINQHTFGTGVYQKDFGKVRVGVVTILFIPIQIGMSW